MPRNIVQLKIDRSGATRRINNALTRIEEAGEASVKEIGRLGKAFAQRIAPYYSGKTFQSIKISRPKGPEVIILAKNILPPSPRRKIANFDLVRWLHTSPKARQHIKSGDEKFMYTTREYLRGAGVGIARKEFGKIVGRI